MTAEGRQSLMLMAARRCGLNCSYCPVVRTGPEMSLETARRAVDWLMTSKAPALELGFMGGEPLRRRAWMAKVVSYAQSRRAGRALRLLVATNGLPIDAPTANWLAKSGAEVLLALDGDFSQSAARFGADQTAFGLARGSISRLRDEGVEYAVNCVIGPDEVESLPARLKALASFGAKRIQVAYRVGVFWPQAAVDSFARALTEAGRDGGIELLNRGSGADPVLLKNALLVDEDGEVWLDDALFLEGVFPQLRRTYRLGRLGAIAPRDEVDSSARVVLARATEAFAPGSAEGKTWLNNVALGQRAARAMAGLFDPRDGAEDPAIRRGVVAAGLSEQARFLKENMPWLDRLFLFVRGGCDCDCLFCKNKPAEGHQSLEELDAILAENDVLKRRRIALVGNEPLAHPRIAELVKLCRQRGFDDVEVMTSGLRLAELAAPLARAGVSAYALALHGSTAKLHDALTRTPGSFAKTLQGVAAARQAGAKVFVHANACRENLADLPALEKLARKKGWPFSIHPLRPKDPDGMNVPYEKAAPSYAELRKALTGRVSSLTGFPACVAKRIQGTASCPGTDVGDSVKLYLLHQAFVKPAETCAKCADRGRCLGTFEAHLKARPGDRAELVPS